MKPTASLATVIARIESDNNHYAVRFEPGIFKKFADAAYMGRQDALIARIARANKCNHVTAAVIFSSSWGAYQIMGFNLYGGMIDQTPIGLFLETPSLQAHCFNQFVRQRYIDFAPTDLAAHLTLRKNFARAYNGSLGYLILLRASLKHFGYDVVV